MGYWIRGFSRFSMKRLNSVNELTFGIAFAMNGSCHKDCKGVLGHDQD